LDLPEVSDGPGTVIGSYKLLEQIGEGGMGVVYMAEQEQPLRRKVALKIVKPGMDSKQVVTRFEAERQALALMDHPHIAKIHDAGTSTSGRPYFVMELVRGVPVTQFCDQRRFTPRERLELFATVCQAVQHAHQKGIIHRDLKPTNVLVTLHDVVAVPKVIDFGIAKATTQRLTERTLFTHFTQLVGTPLYMSPEQAEMNGLDVDTRSDVYALGVLLYELLTGTTPFESETLKKVGLDEMRRIIREEEPPTPSQRLSTLEAKACSTVSERRGVEERRLRQLLQGELDWIVMKALEKDRNRRYETASAFAADVQRYLQDEPVQACPPSAGYRLRKYWRRHRGTVLAVGLVLLALLGGIAATTWQAVRATGAEDQAKTALVEARQAGQQTLEALHALTDEVLERLMTRQMQLTEQDRAFLRKVLGYYEGFAATRGDGPESRAIRAEGYYRVGVIRTHLGEWQDAQSAYEHALALYQQLADDFPTQPDYRLNLARSHHDLGRFRGHRGAVEAEYNQALALYQQLVADFPRNGIYRVNLATVHDNRGEFLAKLGQHAEAEADYRQALALYQQVTADFPTEPRYRSPLTVCHNRLGNLLQKLGKPIQAETEYRQALAISKQLAEDFPADPNYRYAPAFSHTTLGILLTNLRRRTEAEAEFRQALALNKQVAADFPAVPRNRYELAKSHYQMGNLLRVDLGKRTEAEDEFRQALTLLKQLAADFPKVPGYRESLAQIHQSLGRMRAALDQRTEAEAEFRQACALLKQLATDSPNVPSHQWQLGELYGLLGKITWEHNDRPAEGLPWFDQAIEVLAPLVEREPRLAPARLFLCDSHRNRAVVLIQLERFADATRDWDRALELADGTQRVGIRLGRAYGMARFEPMKAVAEAEAVLQANPPWGTFYNAACVYAVSSARIQDAALSDQYAARAVALLRQARDEGYLKVPAHAERVKKDADLESLRGRTDFQELLAEIAAAKK
jgi:tetratricopeptide (TPR) repeat protein